MSLMTLSSLLLSLYVPSIQEKPRTMGDPALGIIPFPFTVGRTNKAKIKVFHTRAAYISSVLGGSILPPDTPLFGPNSPQLPPSPIMSQAGALLPEGIEAVIADERDNTVIIVFVDDDA